MVTVKRIQSSPRQAPTVAVYTEVFEGLWDKREGDLVYELIDVEEIKELATDGGTKRRTKI